MNARDVLRDLVGTTIPTLTGHPNSILAINSDEVVVATKRSPQGQGVPIAWVQEALDRLAETGEIEISVPSVGYRSAFIGAVLSTIPGVVTLTRPRRIRLEKL